MMNQYVYGGRIDNAFDVSRLDSFVQNLFSSESFSPSYSPSLKCCMLSQNSLEDEKAGEIIIGRLGYVKPVINGVCIPNQIQCRISQKSGDNIQVVYLKKFAFHNGERYSLHKAEDNWINKSEFVAEDRGFYMQKSVVFPEKTKYRDILNWIQNLSNSLVSSPEILGLPPRAELVLQARRAEDLVMQLVMIQDISMNDSLGELNQILDIFLNDMAVVDADTAGIPKWMRRVAANVQQAKQNEVPETLRCLRQDARSLINPLYRFLSQEFAIGHKTLNMVIEHIDSLQHVVNAEMKCSNLLRSLFISLEKEIIPKQWKTYPVKFIPVSLWFKDFRARVDQLNEIVKTDYINYPYNMELWLGGLFSPEGFLAATRQYVASKKNWPLEKLQLQLEIGKRDAEDNSFVFTGLSLYGADWKEDDDTSVLLLTDKAVVALPPSKFLWRLNSDIVEEVSERPKLAQIKIPVYLNSTFKQFLISVNVHVYSAIPKEIWTQRSVALGTWSG